MPYLNQYTHVTFALALDYDQVLAPAGSKGQNLVAINKALIVNLLNTIKKHPAYQSVPIRNINIKIIIATARQCVQVDKNDSYGKHTDSCFGTYLDITEETKLEGQKIFNLKIPVTLDNYLLPDTFHHLLHGTIFNRAINQYKLDDADFHKDIFFDADKLLINYSGIHRTCTSKESSEQTYVVYYFVDDHLPYHENLHHYFLSGSRLPRRSEMNLIHYKHNSAGKFLKEFPPIIGRGEPDKNWEMSLFTFYDECNIQGMELSTSINFWIYPLSRGFVTNFLYEHGPEIAAKRTGIVNQLQEINKRYDKLFFKIAIGKYALSLINENAKFIDDKFIQLQQWRDELFNVVRQLPLKPLQGIFNYLYPHVRAAKEYVLEFSKAYYASNNVKIIERIHELEILFTQNSLLPFINCIDEHRDDAVEKYYLLAAKSRLKSINIQFNACYQSQIPEDLQPTDLQPEDVAPMLQLQRECLYLFRTLTLKQRKDPEILQLLAKNAEQMHCLDYSHVFKVKQKTEYVFFNFFSAASAAPENTIAKSTMPEEETLARSEVKKALQNSVDLEVKNSPPIMENHYAYNEYEHHLALRKK